MHNTLRSFAKYFHTSAKLQPNNLYKYNTHFSTSYIISTGRHFHAQFNIKHGPLKTKVPSIEADQITKGILWFRDAHTLPTLNRKQTFKISVFLVTN